MGKTSIEWTDASWNPIVGCTEVSPGCANCYAARLAATRLKNTPAYKNLAVLRSGRLSDSQTIEEIDEECKPRWTGEVRFLPERLEEPLHWRKPRRIFVCDMGDLFHESVHGDWIDQVLAIIDQCPQHTFQILTKRVLRMHNLLRHYPAKPNVWLGVSVENQHFADQRREVLRELAAKGWLTWVSYEPALGGVNWIGWQFVKWVVSGGESGLHARPSHPDWHSYTRDYCQQQGIAYLFKQWGAWIHVTQIEAAMSKEELEALSLNTRCRANGPEIFFNVGKKRAGRQLDGSDWNQFPESR